MHFSFDHAKRASNLNKHGLDLADAQRVIESGRTVMVASSRCARQIVMIDGAVIEHFKAKAGARGYQTLINEAPKQAIQAESLEAVIRETVREELRRARVVSARPSRRRRRRVDLEAVDPDVVQRQVERRR